MAWQARPTIPGRGWAQLLLSLLCLPSVHVVGRAEEFGVLNFTALPVQRDVAADRSPGGVRPLQEAEEREDSDSEHRAQTVEEVHDTGQKQADTERSTSQDDHDEDEEDDQLHPISGQDKASEVERIRASSDEDEDEDEEDEEEKEDPSAEVESRKRTPAVVDLMRRSSTENGDEEDEEDVFPEVVGEVVVGGGETYADGGALAARFSWAGPNLCDYTNDTHRFGLCLVTRTIISTDEKEVSEFCCRSCDSFRLRAQPSHDCASQGKGLAWLLWDQEHKTVSNPWQCTGDYNAEDFQVSSTFVDAATRSSGCAPGGNGTETISIVIAPQNNSHAGSKEQEGGNTTAAAGTDLATQATGLATPSSSIMTTPPAPSPTQPHCDTRVCNSVSGWAWGCGWRPDRCGGCAECQQAAGHADSLNVSASSFSQQPGSTRCAQFCLTMEGSWSSACRVSSGNCSGCLPCQQEPLEAGRCSNFCKEFPGGWSGACGWQQELCGGCSRCQLQSSACDLPCSKFCEDSLRDGTAAAELCGLPTGNCSGCSICLGESRRRKYCANFCNGVAGGWASACNQHQAWCGGCTPCGNDGGKPTPTARMSEQPRVPEVTRCANFCKEVPGGWAVACNIGGAACASCTACQQSLGPSDRTPCAGFCATVTGGWRGACQHRAEQCGGCLQCKDSIAVLDEAPCANFCSTVEHGWAAACGLHSPLCSGCHQCKVIYRSDHKPCHQFCLSFDKGWPGACTLSTGNCSGCKECHVALGANGEPCASHCESFGFAQACTNHREVCGGCSACNSLPLQAPTSGPCDSFCHDQPEGWLASCSLHKSRCGGCEPCQQVLGTHQPCQRFCGGGEQGWGAFCNWHSEECSGCNPCQGVPNQRNSTCAVFCSVEAFACDVYPSFCSGCDACAGAHGPRQLT